MSNAGAQPELIVLAPAWPGETRGCEIALRASLLLYLKHFRRIHYICISDSTFERSSEWAEAPVSWIHAQTIDSPKWLRFLQSLFGPYPAITVRYARAGRAVMQAMRDIARHSLETPFLVIEDIPTACYLPRISREFREMRIALHSQNIVEKGFEPLCNSGSILHRLCWRFEVARVRRFEERVCELADKVWAISRDDARDYEERLGVRTDGIIGICMDVDRYAGVPEGAAKTVVHVGTADLRKGKGLTDFVEHVWPLVRAKVADARLVLAGRGTDVFSDPGLGIEGLGFVKDDRDVLKLGRVFVNTQQIGAGVQLKSVVAMLAGKALISTPMAAEGIEGENGKHFIVAESNDQMVSQIVDLIVNRELASTIGTNAGVLAREKYSESRFLAESSSTIEDFIKASPVNVMSE